MKISKEELVIANADLQKTNASWSSNDEVRRLEFAKAFHWKKPQEMYSPRENMPRTPTWSEIFIELGKLLACRDFRDLEGNISEVECKLQDLETSIRKEIHPNL